MNPDVDDRVIKPNEARDAVNLRFGASTEDTNLSGGTLILGNTEIDSFLPPSGTNRVVGVYSDLEARCVYFALYNGDTNHGLYRISGNTNAVEAILSGSWLNFQNRDDYNVSIAAIDGKLYWTDNVNPPRMVNIEKGVRTQADPNGEDVYPVPVQDWHYTQIKRRPGLPLSVTFELPELEQYSIDYGYTNQSLFLGAPVIIQQPVQFSYYYIYDNEEESRIAPVSQCVFFSQINNFFVIQIPINESNNYLYNNNIVKKIVLIWRNGNDSPWFVVASYQNIPSAYTVINGNRVFQVKIGNINLLRKNIVSSDIIDADFDSIPLVSVSNETAQNRLNHGNYILDYDSWNGLSLSVQQVRAANTGANNRTFKDNGIYNVGIGLYDEYGRKIGVTSVRTVQFPSSDLGVQFYNQNNLPPLPPADFNKELNSTRWLNYTVTGEFPEWCKYWAVEYTKALNYTYFNKTIAKVYYWYTKGNVNSLAAYGYFPPLDQIGGAYSLTDFTFKGYAFELLSGEPFVFNEGENQVLRVFPQYADAVGFLPAPPFLEVTNEYTIKAQINNLLFVEEKNKTLYRPSVRGYGYPENDYRGYRPLYYQIELASMSTNKTPIFWQSTNMNRVGEGMTGTVYGDCYINKFKKTNGASNLEVLNINGGQVLSTELVRWKNSDQEVRGYAISMNPTNIFAQNWDSDIGQSNIIIETQKQIRIPQGIIFSSPIVQGTQINGLSRFNSLDSRLAPAENGPITALVTTNATQREPGVMLAIGTYGISSFYYNAIQLTNVDGSENVTTTDAYLASQRPLLGQYGCSRPMSVTKTPLGTVYWWSDVVNDLIRYTNAGLERLGLTFSFGNFLRRTYNDNPLLITWYDQVTDEIILSGQGTNPALPLRAAVFSERYKTFQGQREYFEREKEFLINYPERATGLPTKQYYFINGRIFVSDVEATGVDNNFLFGEYKNPALTIVTNEAPASVKQWNQIKVFGAKPTGVSLSCPSDSGSVPLVSSLSPQHFIERKGDYEAAIRRAENTTGGLLAGKIMESRIIYSTFAFDANTFVKLNFVEIKGNTSIVQ